MIPSLADHLAGNVEAKRTAGGRVHVIEDDDRDEPDTERASDRTAPIIRRFDPTAPKEEPMPRRPRAAAPGAPPPEAVSKLKRKYTRLKGKGAKALPPLSIVDGVRFAVDDRGTVSINLGHGQPVVELDHDTVERLEVFLDSTKALRK